MTPVAAQPGETLAPLRDDAGAPRISRSGGVEN